MDLDVKAKATMLGAVMLIVSTYPGFPLGQNMSDPPLWEEQHKIISKDSKDFDQF